MEPMTPETLNGLGLVAVDVEQELRDRLAGLAMHALLVRIVDMKKDVPHLARDAYDIADAMIEARAKEPPS